MSTRMGQKTTPIVALASAVLFVGCASSTGGSERGAVAVTSTASTQTTASSGAATTAATVAAVQVAVGQVHACAVRPDGALFCWGDNEYGAVGSGEAWHGGSGNTQHFYTPTRVALPSPARSVSAGSAHTCVALRDGAVHCFGRQDRRQLGDRRGPWTAQPEAIAGLANVTQVVSGGDFNCALRGDAQVLCWGDNQHGQLGHAGTASCVFGTRPDGNTEPCDPTPTPVAEFAGATQLAAGREHVCALMADRTVRCLGSNSSGQLGDGTTEDRAHAVTPEGVTNVQSLSASGDATCAARADGTVWCWGRNSHGQLGDGTTQNRTHAVQVAGVTDAVSVASGGLHACALRRDGTAHCWGDNAWGQLGRAAFGAPARAPARLEGVEGVRSIAGGWLVTCAVDGAGEVHCVGSNMSGQLGRHISMSGTEPARDVTGVTGATQIAAGDGYACAVVADGAVRCWGSNQAGVTGRPVLQNDLITTTPTEVAGVRGTTHLALSAGMACARTSDARVFCWGPVQPQSDHGPVAVQPAEVAALAGASTIVATNNGVCGLVAAGAVRCVESERRGTSQPSGPLRTQRGLRGIVASNSRTCVIAADQTVRCAGSLLQYEGAEGENRGSFRGLAAVAPLGRAEQLAMGSYHLCARAADGAVRCTGDLGYTHDDAEVRNALNALRVGDVVDMAAAEHYACFAQRDGRVQCFGEVPGLAPAGDTTQALVALRALEGMSDVVQLAASHSFVCGRTRAGAVRCVGSNEVRGDGALGAISLRAVRVALPSN